MFYSQLILAKKGPLGTIWIAAHLERKLRKNQVTETNISVSVDSILFPEAPIALRLSGHLLLGVVRIYSRKVNYLFHDCSEALTKIKQAFQAGAVDLPPEASTAPFHAITLPEIFDLEEFEPLEERERMLLARGAVDQHVTARELITLQATMEETIYFGPQIGLDDRLPQAELPRMGLDFEEEREKEARERERSPRLALEEEVAPSVEEYRIDFDRLDEMEAMEMEQLPPMAPASPTMVGIEVEMEERPEEMPEELEELAPVVEEPVSPVPLLEMEEVPEMEILRAAVEAPTELAPDLFAIEREMARPSEEFPARAIVEPMVEAERPLEIPEIPEELREISVAPVPGVPSPRRRPSLAPSYIPADEDVLATLLAGRVTPSVRVLPTPSEEAPPRRARRAPKPPPRKRKPVLDVQMILNGDQMREQLADTSDIRRVRKKAPCTRLELWTVERLAKGNQVFNEPSIPGLSNVLRELYTRVLVPGPANLPLAEVIPEVAREEVPAPPPAEAPVEEPEVVEFPIVEPEVVEFPIEEPEVVEFPIEEPEVVELPIEEPEVVEFPVLEPEPEPHMPPSPPAAEPILIEVAPVQPELLQEVAAEAEAVAEAVAEGAAVVVEGVDGRTIIVLEDDGTILDEGPSALAEVKEEMVREEIQEEELDFLGEPKETVILPDDEEPEEVYEPYDVSILDVEAFSGWSARTRAVGGYLQGVFESLGATIEGRPEDSPRVGLHHTLRGKTRKEASRLFFETLVLKTKDYVDVEEPQPYGEVYLSARPKLLKGSF